MPVDEEKEKKLFFDKMHELERKHEWEITVKDYKVWTDYLPLLPFAVSSRLEKDQMNPLTHTLHLGSYVLGGFDNTEGVAEQAIRGVKEHIYGRKHTLQRFANLNHAISFFRLPSIAPVTTSESKEQMEPEDYASIPGGLPCSIL